MLLSAAVAPIATVLLKDFMQWIEGINNTLSSDSGMASLQKWLSDMYPVFKDMVIVVAEFVAGLVGMARDGAPLAIAFLSWLRDVGPKIKDWIESVASRWGPLFNDIIGTLGRLLGVFGDIVGFLADVLKPVVEVVFGKGGIFDEAVVVLEILTGALNQLPDLLGWVGDKFGKLGEIVGFVMDKIKWVMDHLGWLNKLDPRNWSGGHDPSKSVPLNPFLRGDNTAAVSPDGPTTVIVPPVGSGSPLTGVGGLTTNSRDTASKGVTIGAVHVYPADFDSFIQDMNRHMTNAPLEPDMAG